MGVQRSCKSDDNNNTPTNEVWKEISGSDYFVSNNGRVKNSNGFILTVNPTTDGYVYTVFKRNGRLYRTLMHRLVCEHFLANPEQKPYVNHKNGIKHDNRLSNLEWSTPKENMCHARDNLLAVPVKGTEHYLSKLTEADVKFIRTVGKDITNVELSKRFNVTAATICCVKKRVTWKHVA